MTLFFSFSHQIDVEFGEPRISIYNCTRRNLCYNSTCNYEYEISFEDSQLVVRTQLFDKPKEESKLNVNFPRDATATWHVISFEKDSILCFEQNPIF